MNYYIVDDEIGIIKTLENIIESRNLGEVIGYSTDPEQGICEILALHPQIVLVDLLMSGIDGIALVERIKKQRPFISFVMISKVTDKFMVEQAYNAGVEFFINKPINIIEVSKVLSNVSEKNKMESLVEGIKGMFEATEQTKQNQQTDSIHEIQILLGLLGMMGERGTEDILAICSYLSDGDARYSKEVLQQVAKQRGDSAKNMEQRIRRAIKKGLTNVANLGLDDYSNEVFQVYANYVFDFKNVKEEMDYIKGNASGGGRVSISKFIEGLLLYRKTIL